VLVAGAGVFVRKAWEPLMKAAERNEFAVVGSGPMRGHFPDDHRLSGRGVVDRRAVIPDTSRPDTSRSDTSRLDRGPKQA
jgi:hypothetical protein